MVASVLVRGQVAVIQVDTENSDDPHVVGSQNMARDSISFMLLAPVGSGTTIYFTDRSWNGTVFAAAAGDGTYAWTASTDLAAGTIININEAELTAAGIELDGTALNADTGDTIYVYQGSSADTPTTFLHAVDIADGNATFNGSLTNTGLVNGTSAVAISADNATFGERTWNHQANVLFANINNNANWSSNTNSPHTDHVEGTSGGVAPDVQLWMAGISGGHGLFSVNGDATQNGGIANGYNVGHHFQNTAGDGDATTFTQRFWSPTHILFDTVAGKFFVVDSSGSFDRVLQGNISDLLNNPGTAPTMTILWRDLPAGSSDGDGVTSIQLDKVNGDVYFTADNKLHRVDYDTANQTAVTLFDFGLDEGGNKNFTNELVLDLANSRAFIIQTESFSDFIESPPGSGIFIVGTVMYQNSIHQVSGISPSDTNATGNTELQLNFTEAYDDDDNPFGDQLNEFNDMLGKITDVELNTATGEIWFTAVQINAGVNGETGGIYRATLAGGTLTVTTIHSETNATNRNYTHIHVDEETGFYYVSSVEPGESGNHAIYRGSLSAAAGTAPTLFADVGNINDMTPRDMTLESAPTLSGTAIAALGVTEQSADPNSTETGRVFLFSGLTAGDIDTPAGDELVGAIVRISANFVSEASTIAGHTVTVDYLRIETNLSGTIAASGIAYSYDSATGVMTLSGAATVAEYAAALALVQFSTSGDNVTNDGAAPSRTIAASVFDGLLYSDEITNTVTVTGINDTPVNSDAGANNGTEDTTYAVLGLSVVDADANPATAVFVVTLSVDSGTLAIQDNVAGGLIAGQITDNNTASVTLTGTQNQINATFLAATGVQHTPGANVNGVVTLTMVSNDGGASGNDPGDTGTGTTEEDTDAFDINVAAVNDAPAVAGDGTEDSPVILEDLPFTNLTAPTVSSLFSGQFTDALDDQTAFGGSSANTFAGIAIVANGSSGATGQWQYWTGAVWTDIGAASADAAKTLTSTTLIRFNPTLNYNGAAPTLTAHLIESGGPVITNGGTVDLNPAPPTTGASAVYSSGTVVLSQAITPVNDAPTSTNLNGDLATFTEGAASAQLDVGGNATIADVDSTNFDGGTLTVDITVGEVAAQDQFVLTAVGGITFDATTVSSGGIQFATYTGGSGGTPLVFTFDADATPAAVQTLLRAISYANSSAEDPTDGDRTLTWTLVDGDGTLNSGVDTLTVTTTVDVNSINDAPAGGDETVVLNEDDVHPFSASDFNFSDTDGDSLLEVVLTTLPTGGTLYLNSVAITLAGTAVTAADIGAGLLTYEPAADANGTGYDSFTFQVRDDGGTDNGGQNTDQSANTITFNVTALNDAPVLTVQDTTVSGTEDVDVVFNAAGLNAITVADVDDVSLEVTLTVLNGTLTLFQTTGLSFTTGTGTAEATMTFSGTAADINAALEGLVYRGDLNYDGSDTLSVTVDDGDDTDSEDITITLADDGELDGTSGNDVLTGTPLVDYFDLSQGGDDTVSGLASNDAFYFGPEFDGADSVDGGAGDNDQIGLEGDYSGANALVLGPTTITNVEVIALLPGFDYDITTVDGNVPAGTRLRVFATLLGAGDDFTFDGSAESNGFFQIYGGLGTDDITTGAGNDGIYFGPNGRFDPGVDRVDGGTGLNDQMALDGDYTLTLDGTAIQNIDVLALLKGVVGDLSDYNLTVDDTLLAAGEQITLWGTLLETALTIDGSAESDGALKIYGGTLGDTLTGGDGADWIWGGLGADTLDGGLGADVFHYANAGQSAGAGFDKLVGLEAADTFDLPVAVSSIATAVNATLSAGTMSADLEGSVTLLGAGQALLFTANAGDMDTRTFLIVDANGTAGYQHGSDFLIELDNLAIPIDNVAMFT